MADKAWKSDPRLDAALLHNASSNVHRLRRIGDFFVGGRYSYILDTHRFSKKTKSSARIGAGRL